MDSIGNFLSQISNAYRSGKEQVETLWSKMREALAKLIVKEGYLNSFEVVKDGNNRKKMIISLKYDQEDQPAVSRIERVSKPGRRFYSKTGKAYQFLGGLGMTIVSTPKGVMSGKEARNKRLGGEVICHIFR